MLKGRNILIGVTGSIAAYKAAILVRSLVREGADVRTIMTPLAREFITPLTLATLSRNPILVDFFDPEDGRWNSHVSLGEWADAFLIAPATANTLAKMAAGVADNLLLTTYLSARCPVLTAPAMDMDMYAHVATQTNLATLRSRGVVLIEPDEGELASGLCGKGRMAEPEKIVAQLEAVLASRPAKKREAVGETVATGSPDFFSASVRAGAPGFCPANMPDSVLKESPTGEPSPMPEKSEKKKSLQGKRIMVTAGPTREAIDPVRYISNHSTGKMGYAIAGELAARGAEVYLVSGPTDLTVGGSIHRIDVVTAGQMYHESMRLFPEMDGAVMCAAVADYTPVRVEPAKVKREPGENRTLDLEPTADIAAELGKHKGNRLLAGFALETDDETRNAQRKLESKNFDFIVLNSLRDAGAGFGTDTNKISILFRSGERADFPLKSKSAAAGDIVDAVERFFARP